MIRIALVGLIVAVGLTATACGEDKSSSEQVSRPQLTNLRDIGQLRSLFNARSDQPRLIVLVSPT